MVILDLSPVLSASSPLLQASGELIHDLDEAQSSRWRQRFEEEHAYHLTRSEIAHYVVETTKALADLLGISIDEEADEEREHLPLLVCLGHCCLDWETLLPGLAALFGSNCLMSASGLRHADDVVFS
ncbi:hypothetical protein [Reticulibacter mediterranei]|uniref:hypothetical protein n=1 Tax=Reticulibacter mediterranei TaxID=2778369 RepID=UPI001C690753|nr:hypothetical protein [Reticulibacter mediterranei]